VHKTVHIKETLVYIVNSNKQFIVQFAVFVAFIINRYNTVNVADNTKDAANT